MKTTHYFATEVLGKKRPYMKREWCMAAITAPDHKVLQPDGRIRYYKYIEDAQKFVRVITLEDGETVHNIFYDRRFKPKEQ
ncbi:MAG: hypothetical protein EBR02_01600 [Alphaproteobacteria bacterium]|nr:hypothetical protein [Alphaproteobacteria bacterium]